MSEANQIGLRFSAQSRANSGGSLSPVCFYDAVFFGFFFCFLVVIIIQILPFLLRLLLNI